MNLATKKPRKQKTQREKERTKKRKVRRVKAVFIEKFRKQDPFLLLIVGYSLLQGVITVPGCVYRLMTFLMVPLSAALQLIFFVLGVVIVIGSLGLYRMKPWGLKTTQMTYVVLLPVLIITIKNNLNAGALFLGMRAVDTFITLSILYYLSKKRVINLFK